MPEFDLVIQGGSLVTHENVTRMDIGIRGENIAAWGTNLEGKETIDASGLLVLPGGVDPHVHLQMPTPTTITSDDWNSGTLAAACGGTTTVIDFVEPNPGQSLQDALQQRKAEANDSSWVDFALHMTITDSSDETLKQIPAMMKAGVSSFKLYTTYDGMKLDYPGIFIVMKKISASGGICMVHAEDDLLIQRATQNLISEGRIAPQNFPFSRPPSAELEAVNQCIELAWESKVNLYLVHLSTSQSIRAVSVARYNHIKVIAETCPQYLLLDQQAILHGSAIEAAALVCSPPLREVFEKELIWNALEIGQIQSVGSDHCSFRIHPQKEIGLGDFRKVPGGLPGIELRYPLMHTYGVLNQCISLQNWVNICSTQPAKIFGIFPQKGSLAVGSDADIVLFDPQKKLTINPELLHEQVDYSPYNGVELTGYPLMTIVKGRVLIKDGNFIEQKKSGKFLHCGLPEFM